MRVNRKRIAYLALCVIDEASERCSIGPVERTPAIRLALACLHVLGDENRSWIDCFWETLASPNRDPHDLTASIARHAASAAAVQAIGRGCGIVVAPGFSKRLGMSRMTRYMVDQMRDSKYDHDIVATKGHPRSDRGRRLVAERMADGKPIDGSQ